MKTTDDVHELPVELKRTLGQHLAEHDANHMDLAGNCRLVLGHRYVAHVEGRTRERAAEERRGLRVPGYQVLFAIRAEPELLDATVRRLADAAGTGKTAAAETLRRPQDENLIAEVKGRRCILEAKIFLERWIAGYATHVRPRLLIGTYRTADRDPEALERHVEEALADKLTWGFGGGAAAARLARFYRGERTVVHLEKAPLDLQKRLQAQRADDGPFVLLSAPGPIAFKAGASPEPFILLLICTKLLVTYDPRAREAANEVWERHLTRLQ